MSYNFKILKVVEVVNKKQKLHLMLKFEAYFKIDFKGKHFDLWGLALKPNTDDIPETLALYLIDALMKAGTTVTLVDPEVMPYVEAQIGDKVVYARDQYSGIGRSR